MMIIKKKRKKTNMILNQIIQTIPKILIKLGIQLKKLNQRIKDKKSLLINHHLKVHIHIFLQIIILKMKIIINLINYLKMKKLIL